MENVIAGSLYIVPEPLCICEESKYLPNRYGGYDVLNSEGIQVCVICGVRSHECEDWTKNKHPILGKISPYFPCELFMGKREGDNILIDLPDKSGNIRKCLLVINTHKSVFRELGSFHEVLSGLVENMTLVPKTSFNPPISKMSQTCFLVANKEKYTRSLLPKKIISRK